MSQLSTDASERWHALLDAAVDAIIVIDSQGIIELFNHSAEKMFGYSASQVIGLNVSMLMPQPYKQSHDGYIYNYLQSGNAKIIGKGKKTLGLKSNQLTFPIYLTIGEVAQASHKQFIGVIRDLTEQEKYRMDAQNIREKLAHVARLNTMGELVAGVAHEMNQPLSAISNYANASKNLLSRQDSKFAPEITNVIQTQEKIEEQVLRALSLNNRLKNFVKRRGGQQERIDVDQLIHDTVELAKIDTRLLEHRITVSLVKQPKPIIFADPVQIQQVLLNLIRNGLDAMEEKGVELKITTEWTDDAHIRISIVDSGNGVDDLIKHELFEPFVTSKTQGMGMGLAVSQTIIHAYGGDIGFSANKGDGTTFSFTLPTITGNLSANGE